MNAPVADDVVSRLYDILADVCGDEVRGLTPDAPLADALVLDSLATVRLTVAINKDFAIDFGVEPGDLDSLHSVDALASVVRSRVSA